MYAVPHLSRASWLRFFVRKCGIRYQCSGYPVRDAPESWPVRDAPPESCPVRNAPPESCPVRNAPPESCPVRNAPPESCPVGEFICRLYVFPLSRR